MNPLAALMRLRAPKSKLPTDASPIRTAMRFTLGLTAEEQQACERAYTVAGDRLEDQPQFRAVLLGIEELFNQANLMAGDDADAERLRELAGYQRALRELHGNLRRNWDAAHAGRPAVIKEK